eukprot:CAMPEP_0177771742 /NCGR_PEP_ID=MMETSP0491_2-20121128/11794_1 /TAXON_ID=63592 /ORGANISM="Tetraselmis chuii, Strain PLY429" /LENGTH=233 /DNA_ID=CAMNT_0019289391 /DNA_START=48 /DNA_END=746 /DNA_ORIENTATION=-
MASVCGYLSIHAVPIINENARRRATNDAVATLRLSQAPRHRETLGLPRSVRHGSALRRIAARRAFSVAAGGDWRQVDAEAGKVLLDREGYKFLDLRTEREFDNERLTKPARCSVNVPIVTVDVDGTASANPEFATLLAAAVPSKTTKLLVASQSGEPWSSYAMQVLTTLGYAEAVEVVGGYMAWTEVFSTSGRRRPPAGRWVSTGTEALKSGLNVGDAAASYTEGGDLQHARW